MTVKYYTLRPNLFACVQWTGSNFAEVDALINYYVHNNGDGTLGVSLPGWGDIIPVETGQWLSTDGNQVYDTDPSAAPDRQVVSSAGPVNYTITNP